MVDLKILNLSPNENPRYESFGAAAFDLAVAKSVTISPAGCVLVSTGLRMVIPDGYEGQLRLRSSMYKKGIVMPNAPGTIDSDYRGEILIAVRNVLQDEEVHFKVGDRIAQMLVKEVPKVHLEFLNSGQFAAYETTPRGSEGFGSTGAGTTPEEL
jgi:dUTP pyrophosphatase